MKLYTFVILLICFSTTLGCNYFKSDHPEAELNDGYPTDLTAKSIATYADQLDKILPQLEKTTSLVYQLGDLSFYVEKYMQNGNTVMLTEHSYNGSLSTTMKEYYFRNDSLLLEKVKIEQLNDEGRIIKNTRTYLRSNTVFKTENKTASSAEAINALPFIDVPLTLNKKGDKTFLENVKTLHEVLAGKDRFEMVFENIATYPDSRYINLKSKIQNSYSASLLVKEKDPFIDSLLNSPIDFKDQKLNIKWLVQDREAIYVPASGITSANGLNR